MLYATWNVWWRFADWSARLPRLETTLRTLAPDIVGLQEVWRTPSDDLTARLGAATGLTHTVAAFSDRSDLWRRRTAGEDAGIGNAVLSRWPVLGHHVLRLPDGGERDEGRLALHARVDTPAGTQDVFSVHVNSSPGHSHVRLVQVDAVVRFVDEVSRDADLAPVVVGDFNAEPDSDEMRRLGGYRTAGPVRGLYFTDVWQYEEQDRGYTWSRDNAHVRDTGEPSARVDYIWVANRPARRPRVEGVGRFGVGAPGTAWPSDHAGVWARLGTGPTG